MKLVKTLTAAAVLTMAVTSTAKAQFATAGTAIGVVGGTALVVAIAVTQGEKKKKVTTGTN